MEAAVGKTALQGSVAMLAPNHITATKVNWAETNNGIQPITSQSSIATTWLDALTRAAV